MNFKAHISNLLKIKTNKYGIRKIGFIEGHSKRMIASALKLKELNLIEPIMLFHNQEELQKANIKNKLKYLVINEEKALQSELIQYYVNRRKGKEDEMETKKSIQTTPYFGAAMLATNKLDGVIGGVHFSSGDILRSAFKTIGTKKGVKTISSVMIMHKDKSSYLWSDISVNIDPTEEQLVAIAKNAYQFADSLNIEKKVAFLSFSTSGSAVVPQTLKIKNATAKFNKDTKYKAIGEVQFDAAYDEKIRKTKYKGQESFEEKPTIFIFPDLNSGNIGYKIAQRMGNWGAIGPILTGIAKPFNDLSRGATLDDVINTAILTALQAFDNS